MNKKSHAWLSWLFILGGIGTLVATIVWTIRLNFDGGTQMSAHGWAAMIAGILISLIVGGALSFILVWSRRNGFDENAHQVIWQASPPSDKSADEQ